MAIETKPTAYPEWNATTGSAGMTQPPSTLRDKGYDDTEKPWARHWNWMMNNIYLWVKHLLSALYGSAALALPDGVYIYDPVGSQATFSLEPYLGGAALNITFLHANDRIVVLGQVRDAYDYDPFTWGIGADNFQKGFTGANAADTYYAYLDSEGVLQLSTVDPSADTANYPICSVDWDGAAVLNNLVDLRTFPTFEDPDSSTRLLAGDPTAALGAATKQYVDTQSPAGLISPYAGRTSPSGWLLCYGQAVSRATYASLYAALCPSLGTFTVTLASPGVFTLVAHGLKVGQRIRLSTTGALPTGLTANTDYYIISAGLTADTFQVSATAGGAAINTSVGQSGVHSAQFFAFGAGDGSTTFNVPDLRGKSVFGDDSMGGAAAGNITAASGHDGALGGPATAALDGTEIIPATLSGGTTDFDINGGTQSPGISSASLSSDQRDNMPPYSVLNYIIRH